MPRLMAAEPIVNAVLAHGLALSDAADASIFKAANAIETEVQEQYREMAKAVLPVPLPWPAER
ncbi:MAG TPA: hypothetical protein VML50_01675 [Anaeromyxobacter sp.]|nr:hypothetical protein [Anaeromyxobacter sp.]